jgi:predicted permease
MLFGASAILLLAACANLASAMLARGTARAAELAVRSALGATRVRLIRQLLTESALLAILGAIAGLLLAALLLRALGLVAPASLHVERVRVDAWVQGFALVVAIVTTVLFGLLPALRLSDTSTGSALREGGRGNVGVGRMRAWNALVASEVALAVMLLAGSVLLIRSFAEVMRVDLGFEPQGVLMAEVNLPEVSYGDSGAVPGFHQRVLEQLQRVPGIEAAGAVNVLPLASGNPNGAMEVEGKPHDERGPFTGYSVYRVVAGDYFRAMQLPVLEGRVFGPGDDARAPAVVVVDQEFAQKEWPGQSAIGKRVRPAGMDMGEGEPWHTVIGVVGSVRTSSIVGPFRQTYYFDHRQRPAGRMMSARYAVRSSLPVGPATVAMRRAVAAVDPQVPVDARPMTTMVSRAVADRRFTMLVLGSFASVALLLALVGIYAVVSYAVAQRTREIGVRLALGATAAEVRRLVMSSALRGIAPGLAVGALLAFAGVRALRSLVYGVSPFDPVALIAAIVILGLVGIASSVLPARRATRVDPLVAMRAE